jgi:tetratricopeptide (TPR) repeat protein
LTAFGIPRTLEQLPQRAVQAALALRRLVVEGTDRGPCPELRLVVHCGPLLVDVQASDPSAQLHPVGETLAWPVRLLGQAAPGDILLSPEVGALVEGWYELEARELPFRGGHPGRNQVYAVVGNKAQWSRLEMHGLRPLSRFIGREQELATLHDWLRQVEAGRGQVAGVVGEPGVGKSRLCYEFVRGAPEPPWLILETRGSAYDQAAPYLPIIALLKSYFRLDDRADLPAVRDTISAALGSLDEALMPTVSALLTLFDVPIEDPQWQALEASQHRQRTLDAVTHLLVWESQRRPLLLVVENLHWIDGETQALLDRLVESLPSARILLLVTYRPEYQHGWWQKTYYTQLRLDPLRRESAEVLLNSLLGDEVALEPLKQRLNERTQGNPFFMEESIRSLVETQELVGGPGAYRPAKVPLGVQVPSSVQATLAARIDRLPPEDKQLLQTASVIGTEVPFTLLQSVAELSEAELRRCLAHLQGVEFLYERRLFPEIEYTFKHALTHEVAYGSLPQARRRALHARLVGGVETLYADHLIAQIDRLAHHAFRGELWDKAALYCRQAGAKAAARSAYRDAVALYEQALDAIRHLTESRDTRQQAIDLRLALRTALLPSGDLGRILDVLREAEALAQSLDDAERLGQVLRFMSIHFRFLGAYEQAIVTARRALELATAEKDVVRQALAQRFLGDAYQAQGAYRRAIDCYRWTMASIGTTRSRERFGQVIPPSVRSRARLALCHAELGMFAEGRALGEEGLRIAEAADQPASIMFASAAVGRSCLGQGDLPRAIPLLERAMGIAREADLPLYGPAMAIALGAAYTLDGRVADAVRLLTQALAQTRAMDVVATQAQGRLALGVAYLWAGDLKEAQDLAERVLASACERQERSHEAYALRLLGEIAAQRHPLEVGPAEDRYRQALTSAKTLGMRPLVAHCHRGLGTLYAAIGRLEPARAELSAAIDLYHAMDMTFWLPQAEAALTHIDG